MVLITMKNLTMYFSFKLKLIEELANQNTQIWSEDALPRVVTDL